MAANPVISEFLAANEGILRDEDGEADDWIELMNVGSDPLDLAGWHLTDDMRVLDKWTFPATALDAGQKLVVFASGKQRVGSGPGGEHHTNFQLDGAGEYLALVEPDGASIASEFAPRFPTQHEDVSYGLQFAAVTSNLLQVADEALWIVPASSDEMPADWNQPGFAPVGWNLGTLGLGYDQLAATSPDVHPGLRLWLKADDLVDGDEPINGSAVVRWQDSSGLDHHAVAVTDFAPNFTNPIRREVAIGIEGGAKTFPVVRFSGTADEMMRSDDIIGGADASSEANENEGFSDVTVIGVYQTDIQTSNNRPFGFGTALADNRGGQNANNFHLANDPSIRKDNGNVGAGSYNQAAPAEFLIRSAIMTAADGGSIREFFNGEPVLDSTANYAIRSDNFFLGDLRFPTGDDVDVAEVIVFDRALDAGERESIEHYLSRKYFDAAESTNQSDGPYAALFDTDLLESMRGSNASVLIRGEFDVASVEQLDLLDLQIRYDDGFIAYLNGVEVTRRQAPVLSAWNSTATSARPDKQAVMTETINLTPYLSLLQPAGNVLAIQGLNAAADDDDFLIMPELVATDLAGSEARYFAAPTPGALNANGRIGFLADTQFSVDRGFFEEPFEVEILSATPGAQIRYTTDGSTPSETNGQLYSEPLLIDRTTTLRASASKPEWFSTNVDTHTYLFLEDVLVQEGAGFPQTWGPVNADYDVDSNVVNDPRYADSFLQDLRTIPTMSLVMDTQDLFGPAGIYSNTQARGVEWERVASVEYILADGSTGFQEDAGLRIWGFGSRSPSQPKHGFRLLFKKIHGDANLDYPLFADSAADEFDNIVLRATNAKSWTDNRPIWNAHAQFIRDSWGRDTMRDMGNPTSHATYVHLYLNGLYWGLYNPVERPDGSFMARYFGGDEEDYDAINTRTGTLEPTDGDLLAWNQLMELVAGDVSSPEGLASVEEWIDIDNMIDYFNIYFYAGARDWVGTNGNNMRVARQRQDGAQFLAFPWDFENTFWDATDNNLTVTTQHQTLARVHAALLGNPEYLMRFADRVQLHFFNQGALTPEQAAARWMERAREIDRAVVGESARWGDTRGEPPRTRDVDWIAEQNRLLTEYFPQRSEILLQQYRQAGLFPLLDAPRFNQHGGLVPNDFQLEIENPSGSGTIYYTLDGSDPRLAGGAVSANALPYNSSIPLTADAVVTARVRSGNDWSALSGVSFRVHPPATADSLVVSELHYNPAAPTAEELAVNPNLQNDDFEFIELRNIGAQAIDLAGIRFADGIDFEFDQIDHATLSPGELLVIAQNIEAFELRYGAGRRVVGPFDAGKLSNDGERIALLAADGREIAAFQYDDRLPWPFGADGYGYSLVLVDPLSHPDHRDPRSWRASGARGGSPGAVDAPPQAAVLIQEVSTHTDPPSSDAVELYNPTEADVDLGGWFLSDDEQDPFKFAIPPGTVIPAGELLVIREDDDADPLTTPPAEFFGRSFALSSLGDEILLSAASDGRFTGYSHGFAFGAAENGRSFIRHVDSVGREHFTAQNGIPGATIGARNDSFLVGEVVITELHYNPNQANPEEPFVDEFIELRNTTDHIAPLFDPQHSSNTWRIDGVGFQFPFEVSLNPGEVALVVGIDPELFRARYGIDATTRIFGPYPGVLDNGGERIALQRPDSPEPAGVPFIDVDVVDYGDRAPWPSMPDGANGDGSSLTRGVATSFGGDPTSWMSAPPSPGAILPFGVRAVVINANQFDPADLPAGRQPTNWQQQHSLLRGVTIEFTAPIGIAGDNLELTNLGVNAPLEPDVSVPLDAAELIIQGNALTIGFPENMLTDGIYQLTILPALTDRFGRLLDGDNDGAPGGAFNLIGDAANGLVQLTGDFNGDGGVSIFDFPVFAYWFAQSVPTAPAYVDLNGDQGVTIFDFPHFSSKFGAGLVQVGPLMFLPPGTRPPRRADDDPAPTDVQHLGQEVVVLSDNARASARVRTCRPIRKRATLDFESLLDEIAADVLDGWTGDLAPDAAPR